jgi:hypothetical protein
VALKRKRLADNQYSNIAAWLMRVEELLSGMEVARQQQQVVAALKDGAAAMKAAQKALSVDDVERLNDTVAEAREHQERVRGALADSSAGFGEADEAAAEAELAALEADAEREELAAMPAVPKTRVMAAEKEKEMEEEEEQLPSVPNGRRKKAQEVEEARELEPALVAA